MTKIKFIINTSEIIQEKGNMRALKMSFWNLKISKVLKGFLQTNTVLFRN